MIGPDDDSVAACAAIVARGDPPRFRAAMAAPVALRRILFPLYAFNIEVARAPWVTSEPTLAAMRLQWWRDALAEIAGGGRVRRHEVVTPLAAVLDDGAAAMLDDLVVARHADVDGDVPEDVDALVRYADDTAGVLLVCAARLSAGGDIGPWLGAVRAAGRAQGVAGLLAAVPALIEKGRHPLPHGDPAAHARSLAETGLAAASDARPSGLPGPIRSVLLVLPEAEALLRHYRRDPGAVLAPPPGAPPVRARLVLAWRAYAATA